MNAARKDSEIIINNFLISRQGAKTPRIDLSQKSLVRPERVEGRQLRSPNNSPSTRLGRTEVADNTI